MPHRRLWLRLAIPQLVSVFVSMLVLLMTAGTANAQAVQYKVLHTFGTGTDGEYPAGSLVFDHAGNLYGVTAWGGAGTGCYSGCGTVFELSARNGHWGEKVVFSFPSANSNEPYLSGSLALGANGDIYGSTLLGGVSPCYCGSVYQLAASGGVWTEDVLYDFLGGSDGEYAQSGLVRDTSGNLYGATESGGFNGNGEVYQLTPNGNGTWTYNVIHEFGLVQGDAGGPYGALTIDALGNIYGTTGGGGLYGYGTVYKLAPSEDSWTETILYNFTLDYGSYPQPDGVTLDASGNLYGATLTGGEYALGTLYKLTPTAGFWNRTVLHTFTGGSDGAYPYGGLTVSPTGALYGTAGSGGFFGYGTVYKLAQGTHGQWNEAVLHPFKATDGSSPSFGVVLDQSGNLYGVTSEGGTYGFGVAFEITQ